MSDTPKLLWLDLETTGLDPQTGRILEVAWALAEFNDPFELIEPIRTLTLRWNGDISDLNDWVQKTHAASGLFRDCAMSQTALQDVIAELLRILPTEGEKPILAGSTIGFDMGFLKFHMPAVVERLHYRLYDVTAAKLFLNSLGMPVLPKAEARRAKDDIEESIRHGRICAEWVRSMPIMGTQERNRP